MNYKRAFLIALIIGLAAGYPLGGWVGLGFVPVVFVVLTAIVLTILQKVARTVRQMRSLPR